DATGAITQTGSTATIDAANLDMNAGTSLALAGTTTVAGTVGLTAGGDVTQAAAITAGTLQLLNTAGSVVLTNNSNDVQQLQATNVGRNISVTSAAPTQIDGTGIDGAFVNLQTAGLSQTAPIKATSLDITNTANSVVLNAANEINSFEIFNGQRSIELTNTVAATISAGGIQGNTVLLNTAGLTQTGVITATSLDVTNSAGDVVLDQSNALTNVEIDNTGRNVNLTNSQATNISAGGIQGDSVLLNTAGLTQTGAITATSLEVTNSAGNVVLDQSNALTNVEIDNTGRDISLTNSQATNISTGGIQGNAVILSTAGLTQAGVITATSLDVTNSAGNVVLDQSNALTNVEIDNTGRNVSLTNSAAMNISTGGIQGSTVVLNTAGLTQTGVITATSLDVTNSAGNVVLTSAGNALTNVEIDNTGRNVNLTNSAATNISAGGIQGDSVLLNTAGLTQTGVITATSLDVTNSAGNVVLDQSNALTNVEIDNTGRDVSLTNSAAMNISAGGIQGDSVILNTAGLTQTGAITTTSLDVTNSAGSVALTSTGNALTNVEIDNTGNSVSLTNTSLTDISSGGIQGSLVTLNTVGLTQTGTIDASAKLTVTNTQGDVTLTQLNKLAAIEIANPLGVIDVKSTESMSVNGNGITGDSVSLDVTGDLTAFADITSSTSFDATISGEASFTSVTASGGTLGIDAGGEVNVQNSLTTGGDLNISSGDSVTLNNASALQGSLVVDATGSTSLNGTTETGNDLIIDSGNSVMIADATVGDKSNIQATGDVEVGTKLYTANDMVIDTVGGFYVSTLTDGIAESATEIDLRLVDGDVRLINGGKIIAPSVLLR
ncbi:MAG: beta strand repeat-containing protein, partial [Pirellulales bacterium]